MCSGDVPSQCNLVCAAKFVPFFAVCLANDDAVIMLGRIEQLICAASA